MCTLSEPARPSSPAQAVAMVHAGLGYLSGCDAAGLGTAAQAEALIGLEQAEARHTAARAKILAAFTAQHGFQADGQFGAKPWLRAVTKVTRGAAAGATGWARRLAAHPVIADGLAAAQISASWARQICDWTDRLPEGHRADADPILLAAALGGADLHDLGALAQEMAERARTGPDRDDGGFGDRAVWLQTTIGGAGRLAGDLTPAGAAALTVVLDALSGTTGPEDTRTLLQRRHDALEEACQRLIAARMLPGRDGQPVHVQVHVDLATLRGLPGAPGLEAGWSPGQAAGWSPARAAADPRSVYLTGAGAEAAACDATVTPVVTGQLDWTALDQLTTLFVKAHGRSLYHHRDHDPAPGRGRDNGRDRDGRDRDGRDRDGRDRDGRDRDGRDRDGRDRDGRDRDGRDAGPGRPGPGRPGPGRPGQRPGPGRPGPGQSGGTGRDLPRAAAAAARHPAGHEHHPAVRARRSRVLPARRRPRRAVQLP